MMETSSGNISFIKVNIKCKRFFFSQHQQWSERFLTYHVSPYIKQLKHNTGTKRFVILILHWKRALIPHHGHLLLLLNHVVIVVKLCCVEGLMEDRCTFNKHSR